MKTLFNLLIVCLVGFTTFSQGGIGPSNVIIPNGQPASGVIDGVYEKRDVLAKKRAIPVEHVRESDYIWGKRTWSYIDLREKINHPLYYPHETMKPTSGEVLQTAQGRYSLFFVLRNAMLNGQIMGYADGLEKNLSKGNFDERIGGDAFIYPAKRDYTLSAQNDAKYQTDINNMIGTVKADDQASPKTLVVGGNAIPVYYKIGKPIVDKVGMTANEFDASSETTDANEAEKDLAGFPAQVSYKLEIPNFYQPNQIVKYLLKEDWFFDKERSVLDVRIIGMAPVIIDSTSSKEKILFWVYFPQVRDVLKNFYAFDAKSTVGGNTFDHLFMTRRFNSVVYKESSLYDRKVEDYRFGADALYESEKVKNTIRTFEHDVWNF